MQRTHGVEHWDPDNCFGCKVQTTSFAPSIFTTTPGGAKAADIKAREPKLEQDLAAYKRMRRAGLSPKATEGAARVESVAESTFEVESGQLAPDKAKGRDKDKGGKEWRRRAEEAHVTIKREGKIDLSS